MDAKRRKGCAVLAVVLCLAVFAGEYSVYYSNAFSFDADARFFDGSVDYEVHSSGADVYDAVLLDGGTSVDQLVVFVDDTYSEHYAEASAIIGFPFLDQEYMASQISIALSNRGFDNVLAVDSQGLKEYLERTLADPTGLAVFVTSYALPSDVYSGGSDDLLMRWISAGGTLYWNGSEIGRFCVDDGELVEVHGAQNLFFGKECVQGGDGQVATSVIENGFTDALTLKNIGLMFAVDLEGVPGALEVGYTEDGYATIGMAPYGKGTVCVFGGQFEINLLDDIGQVVASGLSPATEIAGHQSGDVVRGTVSGSFDTVGDRLYVYIGGTYTKFGGCFHA